MRAVSSLGGAEGGGKEGDGIGVGLVMTDGAVRMLSAEAASPSKLFNASVEANESERD
ncbi:MAG: hypothetical protein SGPRY_011256, partial [Prymnesium sp.]